VISSIGRRAVLTTLGGAAAAWPFAARAQQPAGMRRIGVLVAGTEDDPEQQTRLAGFRYGLERGGWFEGRNVHVEYRYSGAGTQMENLAKELVALQPDVIVPAGTGPTAMMQRATSKIPIVFVAVSDPVGSGFVASLPQPGGNITGMLNLEASITGKWMAMLKEIAPQLTRLALLGNPKTTPYDYFLLAAEALAPSLAVEVAPSRVETTADIERAIETLARAPNGGLIVPPDQTLTANRDIIIALAARHRLPTVYNHRVFVAAGGLMSYGTDYVEQYRQAASYVDRILRGEKPADLPVQVPTKYETVVNLKTAKALGLDVPSSLLVRADEVIE
jgi:putative ABC transport system substrate-binding protein